MNVAELGEIIRPDVFVMVDEFVGPKVNGLFSRAETIVNLGGGALAPRTRPNKRLPVFLYSDIVQLNSELFDSQEL